LSPRHVLEDNVDNGFKKTYENQIFEKKAMMSFRMRLFLHRLI